MLPESKLANRQTDTNPHLLIRTNNGREKAKDTGVKKSDMVVRSDNQPQRSRDNEIGSVTSIPFLVNMFYNSHTEDSLSVHYNTRTSYGTISTTKFSCHQNFERKTRPKHRMLGLQVIWKVIGHADAYIAFYEELNEKIAKRAIQGYCKKIANNCKNSNKQMESNTANQSKMCVFMYVWE